MKCCASPTTFTARNAGDVRREVRGAKDVRSATNVRSAENVRSADRPAIVPAREAAAQFNALLIAVAFKPLATALGFYGDLVVASVSQTMARSERGGLTDRLERIIDAPAAPRPGARS